MGVGKGLLTYPSPHYSTTPLLSFPQFRGLIFPAQTTASPHEELFSLRRSARLPMRRAGACILGAARPHPQPSALGPLCFVRSRIRCNECRPGAVPYVGQTPPLEIRRDQQQTLLKFFCASTPSHVARPSRRARAATALANAIQCPKGAFKKVSEQARGRLVPVKHRATDKTRGRGRPRPIHERTLSNMPQCFSSGVAPNLRL